MHTFQFGRVEFSFSRHLMYWCCCYCCPLDSGFVSPSFFSFSRLCSHRDQMHRIELQTAHFWYNNFWHLGSCLPRIQIAHTLDQFFSAYKLYITKTVAILNLLYDTVSIHWIKMIECECLRRISNNPSQQTKVQEGARKSEQMCSCIFEAIWSSFGMLIMKSLYHINGREKWKKKHIMNL